MGPRAYHLSSGIVRQTISAIAQPYRFYLLQRVQDEFALLEETDQTAVENLLKECGMSEVLDLKLNRKIGRENNREVWC